MTRHRENGERGFALIIAIVVLLFLTMLGMTTLNTAVTDVNVAGKSRASRQALYIAQAGVAWGLDALNAGPFDPNNVGATLKNAALTGRAVTGSGVALFDGCLELPNSPVSFGGGTFRVAVTDDADDGDVTTDSNGQILLRSLGVDASGGKKLIEVTVGAPAP